MAPRIALGLTNLWDGLITEHAAEESGLPAENVEHHLPGKVFQLSSGGMYDVVTGDNDKIDTDLGTATITQGSYSSTGLATAVQTALQAVDGTFTCVYNPGGNNKFRISRGAGNFELQWQSGANSSTSAGGELGYKVIADDTGASDYFADSARWGTHLWVKFNSSVSIDPTMFAVILSGTAGDGLDPNYGDCSIYAHTSDLGDMRELWDGTAEEITLSTRSTQENPIQVGYRSSSAKDWWFLSWRFFDAAQYHSIGVARAYTPVTSSTYNILQIADMGLVDPSEALGETGYPVVLSKYWRGRYDLRLWTAADYRTFAHGIARHGKTDGALIAPNWSGSSSISDGTLTGLSEAEAGLLYYGAFTEVPRDAFGGESSAFLSGSFSARQLV